MKTFKLPNGKIVDLGVEATTKDCLKSFLHWATAGKFAVKQLDFKLDRPRIRRHTLLELASLEHVEIMRDPPYSTEITEL